jgi:multidrug efflux pump subunit AcrB
MANDNNSNTNTPPNNAAQENLGLAGNMARTFIHSPLTPLLLIASLAIGLLGLMITPRQEDPQISVPMVDIYVRYPGASAEQVASLVADPLQRIMSELTGLKHVYSASMRESALVTVQFKVGEDLGASLVKLYDKLESNRDKIPPDVSDPLVKPKSVDDVPIVTLTLWSNEVDDATLNLVALDVLQRLTEVPNTSKGFVVRGRSEQVRIEVQPEKLDGFNMTLGQIAHTISAANSERGVGDVEFMDQTFSIYTGAYLQTKEDIEQLVLGINNGRPVYVRDVAAVILGPSETHSMVRYYTGAAYPFKHVGNGASAVTLAIAKKKGSNGVTVANAVLEQMQYLKGKVIPDNVFVSITRNYGKTAEDKVNELLFKLFVATGAVAILVFVFLGLRAATVVVIVIPVVILITVFSAWLLDYTIDRVSLFALIFSIGILVDDAIVVVENIYRRWLEKGEMDTDTSVDAVREVGNPTVLATFTVIAALLPMGFVTGMMGPYMRPIPALGSVAMLFSLFAAFIFTPWLAFHLKPTLRQLQKAEEKEHRQSERLGRFYHKLLMPLITNRVMGYGFLIIIVAAFFLSCLLFYAKDVRVKMLPLDNKPEFNVVLNMPEGTALPVTANLVHRMAEELRTLPEVTAVQTYAGTASPFNFNGLVRHYYMRDRPWQADIQVQLLDKSKRKRTSHEIAVEARELLKPLIYGGGRFQVVEMPPGPPVLQDVVAEVYGPNAQVRRRLAEDFTAMFEKAQYIDDVDNYMEEDYPVWRFHVNREKALRLGISVDEINKTLEMAMGGYVLGDIKTQTVLEPTLIKLQLPLGVRADFSRLSQLPLRSSSGRMVPIAELGQFRQTIQDKPIYQKDLRPIEYVTGESVGRLASPIYGMLEIEDMLKDYTAPDGVPVSGNYIGPPIDSYKSGFEWSGEWTVTYETFRDMGIAFIVALVLIYMLVVWEFGNFTLPSIIMAPIPLTLIGIVPGHWLLDAEFTATSMIGFIALAGIIVRNSILLVDFSKHEIARGAHVVDAVITACKTRTRPILITALALVAGSSVILFDPIFQGMAVSLLFGVLVSTLLTLVVIPLGCISGRKAFGVEVDKIVAGGLAGGGGATVSPGEDKSEKTPSMAKGVILSGLSQLASLMLMMFKALGKGLIKLVSALSKTPHHPPAKESTPGGASGAPVTQAPMGVTTTGRTRALQRDDIAPGEVQQNRQRATGTATKTRMHTTSVAKVASPKPRVFTGATKPAPKKTERTQASGKKTPPTKVSAVKKIAPLKKRVMSVQKTTRDELMATSEKSAVEPEMSVQPAERTLPLASVPQEPTTEPPVTATADDESSLAAEDNQLATESRSQKKRRRGIRLKKGLHDE